MWLYQYEMFYIMYIQKLVYNSKIITKDQTQISQIKSIWEEFPIHTDVPLSPALDN